MMQHSKFKTNLDFFLGFVCFDAIHKFKTNLDFFLGFVCFDALHKFKTNLGFFKVLFALMLYIPVNNFQSCRDNFLSSWVGPVL